jgi:hypothetical protein
MRAPPYSDSCDEDEQRKIYEVPCGINIGVRIEYPDSRSGLLYSNIKDTWYTGWSREPFSYGDGEKQML